MSVERQVNWLGQMRVDVPNLRALESSISHDFDVNLGKIVSGQTSLVVKGLTINISTAAGNPASSLVLTTAGALVMHFSATEAGTMLEIPDSQPADALNTSNSKVQGGFSASALNYIGIDFLRSADATTDDQVEFLAANTGAEVPRTVPTARILSYVIIISQTPFSLSSNVCPVAIVQTDSSNNVTAVTDCRSLFGRLATGSDVPNTSFKFPWTSRAENPVYAPPTSTVDPFSGGDKSIASLKDWMNATMSMIWEAKSGQYWYSQTVRDGVKLAMANTSVFATNDNFYWLWGGSSGTLKWQGLSIIFENSTQYYNTIANNSVTGVTLTAGQCLYVDINRTTVVSLTPQVGTLQSLSGPTVPGSRFIICWVGVDGELYIRDRPFDYVRMSNMLLNSGGYPTYFIKTEAQLQEAITGATAAGGAVFAFITPLTVTQSYVIPANVKSLGEMANSIITVGTGFSFTYGDNCKLEDMWFDHTSATTGNTIVASGLYFSAENCVFKENAAGTAVSIAASGNYATIEDCRFYGCIAPSTATGVSVSLNAVDAFLNNNTFLT
jgi:hypothetical protein